MIVKRDNPQKVVHVLKKIDSWTRDNNAHTIHFENLLTPKNSMQKLFKTFLLNFDVSV